MRIGLQAKLLGQIFFFFLISISLGGKKNPYFPSKYKRLPAA